MNWEWTRESLGTLGLARLHEICEGEGEELKKVFKKAEKRGKKKIVKAMLKWKAKQGGVVEAGAVFGRMQKAKDEFQGVRDVLEDHVERAQNLFARYNGIMNRAGVGMSSSEWLSVEETTRGLEVLA